MNKNNLNQPNNRYNLTKAEIIDFFESKNIKIDCELCGENKWIISNELFGGNANINTIIMTADQNNSLINSPFATTMLVVCNNCYHVRTHLSEPIFEWVKANKRTQSDG